MLYRSTAVAVALHPAEELMGSMRLDRTLGQ